MKISTISPILKVCFHIRAMPMGEGWVSATDIIQWSGVSHATTYRYLPRMVKLGYIENHILDYRDGITKRYRITTEGRDFLKTERELF